MPWKLFGKQMFRETLEKEKPMNAIRKANEGEGWSVRIVTGLVPASRAAPEP